MCCTLFNTKITFNIDFPWQYCISFDSLTWFTRIDTSVKQNFKFSTRNLLLMCTYRRRSRRTFWTCHILISICAPDSDLDDGDNDDGDGDCDGDGDGDGDDDEDDDRGGDDVFL